MKTSVGRTAGISVLRQSSMDRVRFSRKNARKRINAGFASSDGWKENPAKWNQRCVLCARSRKKTEINISVVIPRIEKTTAGCLSFL